MVKELGCAVISQAIRDYRDKICCSLSKEDKADAKDFIESDRLDDYIAMFGLDLDSSYIRKKLHIKK